MTPSQRECARQIRRSLDALARRRCLSNDDQEALFDRVATAIGELPREPWVLDVLAEVVGQNRRRSSDAIFLLASMADIPGASERLGARLNDPDSEVRNEVLWAIANNRWGAFAPQLNDRLIQERDPSCRNAALVACREIRDPVNLPVLLDLAKQDLRSPTGDRSQLLWGLRVYHADQARFYFEAIFEAETNKASRAMFDAGKEDAVLAAWALVQLGDAPKALAYLVEMLDDPAVEYSWEGGAGMDPGVSLRASQALCDLYGLAFEWGKTPVEEVKAGLGRLGIIPP